MVLLPTVMFGGYSLLRLMTGGVLTPFQQTYFRAGHAHAGVLLVLSLVYYLYLERTALPTGLKWLACAGLALGILAQSGGFFLHLLVGAPEHPSAGTMVTTAGAVLLAAAMLLLAYGVATSPRS
ncbi:MAG TPA: hypothetical protein VHS99_24785 [Chloroflexota bacterium]|nr:hypothetical protein [Chloroflexota bacterium]